MHSNRERHLTSCSRHPINPHRQEQQRARRKQPVGIEALEPEIHPAGVEGGRWPVGISAAGGAGWLPREGRTAAGLKARPPGAPWRVRQPHASPSGSAVTRPRSSGTSLFEIAAHFAREGYDHGLNGGHRRCHFHWWLCPRGNRGISSGHAAAYRDGALPADALRCLFLPRAVLMLSSSSRRGGDEAEGGVSETPPDRVPSRLQAS